MARVPKDRACGFQKLASLRLDVLGRLSDRHADLDYRRKVGLSLLQCRVLGIVGSRGEMSFKALCRETGIEKSHASRIVASLIDAGLIQKASDPRDQRSIILMSTPHGLTVHGQVLQVAIERNRQWMEPLSAQQRELFLDCIELLTHQAHTLAARTQSPKSVARAKGAVRAGAARAAKQPRRSVTAKQLRV